MAKKKNNFFVVWKGYTSGIYKTWEDCQKQINRYPNAKYKGFQTLPAAQKAFMEGYENYWGQNTFEIVLSKEQLKSIGQPIIPSIAVDAACSTTIGLMEYKGVYVATKKEIFNEGPYKDGTNNVGEFLALVHALAYCKKKTILIYQFIQIASMQFLGLNQNITEAT